MDLDYHKLQQQLYEWDPTDPQEELRQLREAAGRSYDAEPTRDYVAESANVTEGSLPLDMDSVSDFAALAGIRIDEKQKKGPEGQAKGDVPMPKMSKPSGTGEQPHPLKDKLVGEGPTGDAFKAGYKNYNSMAGLKKAAGTGKKPAQKTAKKPASQAQQTKLPPELAPYSKALDNVMKNRRLKTQFERLMKLADPSLSEVSKEQSELEESVRDMLWRKLNKK